MIGRGAHITIQVYDDTDNCIDVLRTSDKRCTPFVRLDGYLNGGSAQIQLHKQTPHPDLVGEYKDVGFPLFQNGQNGQYFPYNLLVWPAFINITSKSELNYNVIGKVLTGYGVDCANVIDDPDKNQNEATFELGQLITTALSSKTGKGIASDVLIDLVDHLHFAVGSVNVLEFKWGSDFVKMFLKSSYK